MKTMPELVPKKNFEQSSELLPISTINITAHIEINIPITTRTHPFTYFW